MKTKFDEEKSEIAKKLEKERSESQLRESELKN